jgi:hypothetical protein
MVKRFYWNSDIDEEMFDLFLTFQNELPEGMKMEVWLDSPGGKCIIAEMMKEIFESYDKDKFTLVACGNIFSAAFDLFVAVDCSKHIIPGTVGMVHTTSKRVSIRPTKGHIKLDFSEEKLIYKVKYPIVELVEEKLPHILTAEEMLAYENDKDVFLTTEEIKKFLT